MAAGSGGRRARGTLPTATARPAGPRLGHSARRWAQTPVLAGLADDLASTVHADRRRSEPVGQARALRALGTSALPSLWDRLGDLAMPVRLLVGERNEKFRGIAAAMAGQISDVDVIVVAGAGHAVHLEAPERVAAIMAESARE